MQSFGVLVSAMCALSLMGLATQDVFDAHEREVISRAEHSAAIGDLDVSFVARDLQSGQTFILEGSAIDQRRTPWSTFKIPNLILALETRVADDLDHALPWDSQRHPQQDFWPSGWAEDQTLHSAFRRSAAWAFRDLALEIGSDAYRAHLSTWGYGNVQIADGDDAFWLNHTLAISPIEQVGFLQRLLEGELEISARSRALLAEVSFAGSREDGQLHGKTGSGPVNLGDFDGRFEGWYVGYLDRGGCAPIVFALHAEGASYGAIRTARRGLAERMLDDMDTACWQRD